MLIRIIVPTFVLSLLALLPLQGEAAVVNTLRGFSGEEPGWSGVISLSFSAEGGNTEETEFESGAQLQWRGERDVFRLMGEAKRNSTGGEETSRDLMGHLRHNHHLGGRWHTLAFVQIQENPFQLLRSRTLIGGGARLDLVKQQGRMVSVGAAHMWERERLEQREGHEDFQRLSVFLSTLIPLREGVDLDGVLFYQPRWNEFGDWRLFSTVRVNVDLGRNLTLFSGVQVGHDSRPPAAVEETDWETTTGIAASF